MSPYSSNVLRRIECMNPYEPPVNTSLQTSEPVTQQTALGAKVYEVFLTVLITLARVRILQFLLAVLDSSISGKSPNSIQTKLALVFLFLLLMSHVRDAFGVAPFRRLVIALSAYAVALASHLWFGP